MMKIYLNNEELNVAYNGLQDLLLEKKLISRKGFAVAVNQTVVPKSQWNNYTLKENDEVLIITATQGG